MSEQGPRAEPARAAAPPDGGGPGTSSEPVRRALPDGAVPVRVRRAPKYMPFIVTGAVLGVVLGVVVALVFGAPAETEQFSRGTIVRYLAAILGLLGAVVGAAAALLVERRRRR